MTSPVDICNRALSDIGARANLTSFSENSPAAQQCALWYDHLRKVLLRSAHWSFARAQIPLSPLGDLASGTSPYPWPFKYTYPADALKVRYILPPTPPTPGNLDPSFCMPSRNNRFLPINDTDPVTSLQRKALVATVQNAQAVYTVDVVNPDLFDVMFSDALTAAISGHVVLALTGNKDMRAQFLQSSMMAVTNARVADGNEAIASVSSTPDWILARGTPEISDYGIPSLGMWYAGYDSVSWGE